MKNIDTALLTRNKYISIAGKERCREWNRTNGVGEEEHVCGFLAYYYYYYYY